MSVSRGSCNMIGAVTGPGLSMLHIYNMFQFKGDDSDENMQSS